MPVHRFFSVVAFGALMLSLTCWQAEPAHAQGGMPPKGAAAFNGIQWQHGPVKVTMRNIGEVQVPKGYKFTGEAGTKAMMEVTGNLYNPKDMGLLCPTTFSIEPGCKDWFVVFVWDDIGYVKDDEKANLDANALLESLKQTQVNGNQERAKLGMPSLNITGWEQPPFYDPQTNNLTWAIRVRDGMGQDSINYSSRILGRGGVVSVELVIEPNELQKELPKYKDIIKGYAFQPGQRYAEFREGDRVAAYGLTALIAGGAVAAAAKSGLLGKLGKVVIWAVIGGVALIGGIFKKIFGSKESAA